MAICPEYFPGTTEKGNVRVVPGSKVSDLVLPVALPPPEPKFRVPLVLPKEDVLPEEEVLAVVEVLAVAEVLAEELVLLDADPSQGFQEVTTQSPLPLVEAVLLTVVVVVALLLPVLDVVAPN